MAGPATDRPARRSLRAALVLLAVAVAGFGLVALVHEATRDAIEASAHARRMAAFVEVLGPQRFDNDLLSDSVVVRDPDRLGTNDPLNAYRARVGDQVVAVVLTPVAPDGYAGAIKLLVAIAPDGTLLGVRVTEHRETPGIGDDIDARKSVWIFGFAGKSLRSPPAERWGVRKDGGEFDQFTGATVTPRAVVGAVANALRFFEQHRAVLLDLPATITP